MLPLSSTRRNQEGGQNPFAQVLLQFNVLEAKTRSMFWSLITMHPALRVGRRFPANPLHGMRGQNTQRARVPGKLGPRGPGGNTNHFSLPSTL